LKIGTNKLRFFTAGLFHREPENDVSYGTGDIGKYCI